MKTTHKEIIVLFFCRRTIKIWKHKNIPVCRNVGWPPRAGLLCITTRERRLSNGYSLPRWTDEDLEPYSRSGGSRANSKWHSLRRRQSQSWPETRCILQRIRQIPPISSNRQRQTRGMGRVDWQPWKVVYTSCNFQRWFIQTHFDWPRKCWSNYGLYCYSLLNNYDVSCTYISQIFRYDFWLLYSPLWPKQKCSVDLKRPMCPIKLMLTV